MTVQEFIQALSTSESADKERLARWFKLLKDGDFTYSYNGDPNGFRSVPLNALEIVRAAQITARSHWCPPSVSRIVLASCDGLARTTQTRDLREAMHWSVG